ncbi:MAG: bifunctional 2-polyprenyl-6-hydroxyphenol methylase/3-demethylubiquinol 3-O-methyltransferase UbiG [Rhodospirillaceae bacterium]|nr:bifunctional 2-polyprenyl-6-hydroxyphenol methylase/3-demethylubiquinol 3-O-methyltransferase UbiG [Rhodospirillaceae bacterium]
MPRTESAATGTVSAAEIAKFTAMAEEWWDPAGKFRPLHKFNPERIRFARDRLAGHFGRDIETPRPFAGLSLLDVGCGGGLFSEPMARLGFQVTGIDAGQRNVEVARIHAAKMGLEIDYRCQAPEDLAAEGRCFDVVLILEVVEHVADLNAFLPAAARLVAPGGALVAATINRTLKALALAKIGAEYILRWLPPGTHEWSKFVRPSELAAGLRGGGLQIGEVAGMSYNVLTDAWSVSRDLDVNYMIFATRP